MRYSAFSEVNLLQSSAQQHGFSNNLARKLFEKICATQEIP